MREKRERKRLLLRVVLVGLAVALGGIVQAAWLDNVPVTVVQPNGDTLHLFATGDEFYHYMHDANGYTIVQDPETGYYVYADKVDDQLVATQLIVGRSNPTRGISQPRLTISNEEYRQRRLEIEGPDAYKVSLDRSPNANRGSINHIVIFISFADDPTITEKSFGEVDYMFNETSPGSRSVYNYFKTASYNQMFITTTYYPGSPDGEQIISYVDSHERNYYSPYNSSTNSQGYKTKSEKSARKTELLINAMNYINANSPIPTDLNLDFDGDGKVDVISFAVNSDVDGWGDLLWPSKSSFADDIPVRINGKKPCLYTFELIKSDNFYLNVFCHELTHVFGAPDFYHADKSADNPDPMGKWDIMCFNHDVGHTGARISNASAYIKWKYLNWIDDIPLITEPGVYSLLSLGNHDTNNAYRIASSVPNQYYILEYRFNNEPFDENGYGTGLVIYRVNEEATGNCYSYPKYGIYDELYVFRPNGSVENVGQLGNSYYSIESGRLSFNPSTNPYPFLSDGTLDDLNISIVSMTGSEMSFQYSDDKKAPVGFTATANGRDISMSWTGCEGAVSYSVYREETEIATVTETSYLLDHAICGTHSYYVKANYGSGQSRTSNVVKVTIVYNGPDAIPDLVASTNGNNVNLEWSDITYQSYMLKHHTTPSSAETMNCNNATKCIWIERFSSEELSAHAGMVMKCVSVYVSNSSVNKPHTLYFSYNQEPSYSQNIEVFYSQSFTPTSGGWMQVWIEDEVFVDNSRDLYVVLEASDNSRQYATYQTLPTTSTESFLWEGGEENVRLRKIGSNQHWLITLSVQYPNFTYNVYRNDGHRTVCIARNLETPNYIDTNLSTGFYTYYVTTNYTYYVDSHSYGGESEPSNMVTASIGSYSVATTCTPFAGGTVSGNAGIYPAGSMVTLTATPNTGYAFNGWLESGQVVCSSPTYTFQVMGDRNLVASFRDAQFDIGNVITNPDGSQGVVFYVNPAGTEGWMVALNDASEGCAWGEATNVFALQEVPFNNPLALEDLSGYRNTSILRSQQNDTCGYAASTVDYDNGWYLPSSGQLRKLYAALPFIEEAITAAGGTTLTEDAYWSSSEYSATDAFTPSFAMSNANKTSTCRVRAIHNFVTAGNNVVAVASNDDNMGTASVSGNGTFAYGASVTVTATPRAGYKFDHWSEDGVAVSYDANYQFTFTHSRYLTAHFVVPGSVGSIVVNPDGSKGVVFWLSPDGDEGLMVALEDASEGCQWGEAVDALTLINKPFNNPLALQDVSGNTNTRCIRNHQGSNNEYAASLVDFANGWYLPSVGELRKLYAALPLIESSLSIAGGSTLTEDTYWSSTEYSGSDAATAVFSMGNTNKTSTCRVRAIRHFAAAGPNAITTKPNNPSFGSVSGSGEYAYGQSVTVTATAAPGYVFNVWTENGMIVSYDASYQFSFTRSRSLVANFVAPGSIGSIVTNADGTRGVLFYTYPSGVGGLMVALEDDSEGCAWGLEEDVAILEDQSPGLVVELLNDMMGRSNTGRLRTWYDYNPVYAANQVDLAHGWYLPSAGQLRKLYAALPMIESVIVNANGTLLTEDAYWSSTEQSNSNAWSPSFAMSSSNKTGNCRVRAIHSASIPATIAANVNIEGRGTVTGADEYDQGQTCTLRAVANPGYTFINWTSNRTVVSTEPEYTFVVMGDETYTANFDVTSYEVIATAYPTNGGTVTGADTYYEGTECTLIATANSNYAFVNWTENGVLVSTNANYTFTVTSDRNLVANFTSLDCLTSLSDDFEDGIIDATLWTYQGDRVYEADGLMKIEQNKTDDNVRLTSHTLLPTSSGQIIMDRRFVVHKASNYFSGGFAIDLNGASDNSGIRVSYWHESYVGKYGTYVDATIDGESTSIRLCDAVFDTWFNEKVIVDMETGTLSYFLDDQEIATVTIVGLASKDVSYFTVRFWPYSWFTGHYQYMDYININTGLGVVTQTIELASGVNWVSFNVEITLDELKSVLLSALDNASGIKITSQNNGYTIWNGSSWRGTLNPFDVGQMYVVEVPSTCVITLEAMPINPAEHPITLVNGINWIGFPLSANMSLTNAFTGFAVNGDKVMSLTDDSANYNQGSWSGSLSNLQPGQGYKYKVTTTGQRTLVFPMGTTKTKPFIPMGK